jgi:hypothetical protein
MYTTVFLALARRPGQRGNRLTGSGSRKAVMIAVSHQIGLILLVVQAQSQKLLLFLLRPIRPGQCAPRPCFCKGPGISTPEVANFRR